MYDLFLQNVRACIIIFYYINCVVNYDIIIISVYLPPDKRFVYFAQCSI